MLGVLALRLDDASDVLGGLSATARRVPLELRCRPTDLDQKLLLVVVVVEGGYDDVATLVPTRVVSVVPDDVSLCESPSGSTCDMSEYCTDRGGEHPGIPPALRRPATRAARFGAQPSAPSLNEISRGRAWGRRSSL